MGIRRMQPTMNSSKKGGWRLALIVTLTTAAFAGVAMFAVAAAGPADRWHGVDSRVVIRRWPTLHSRNTAMKVIRWATLVLLLAGSTALAGWFRSASYGIATNILAAQFLFSLIPAAAAAALLWSGDLPKRNSLLPALATLLALLCVCVSEAWCSIEESAFRNEAKSRAVATYSRARWFPYGAHGLISTDGSFSAHD